MIRLEKRYDPVNNKKWIDGLLRDSPPLNDVVQETGNLFEEIKQPPAGKRRIGKRSWLEKLWAIFSKETSIEDEHAYKFEVCGEDIYPSWKKCMDEEYEQLGQRITKQVNVEDFGAKGDGRTDCTEAFKKAIGKGRVHVHIPAGTFIVDKVELPSWTRMSGAGKRQTCLKLSDRAPKRRRIVTNKNYFIGNRNISVENLQLDWNVERLGSVRKTATGNNFSSCLTFAHVKFGWVKNVEAINPGLHCFDISSPLYSYAGDGTRARGGSSYIWLDQVNGYGFGDDGFTSHHSDYIFVSNSHFSDPSGKSHKEGFSNSNGFEVDDGSRHVWLVNNSSTRCFGGVEIKAHANSSAATGVHISGHLSVNDNRSFNFRHIGHHRAEESASLTAYNISAERLVSLAPVFTNLYKSSTPRSLVISGYRNVVINRFLFAGDVAYDYKNQPAAAIQFRARNVLLANGTVKNFVTAKSDISIAGGKQKADNIIVRNLKSVDSAGKSIEIGNGTEDIRIEKIKTIERK